MKPNAIRRILILFVAAFFVLFRPINAQEPNPSAVEGQLLWPENCLPCHGSLGQGDGPTAASIPNPLPDLTDAERMREVVPADYFDIIKNGRIDKMMPPWKNRLNDGQIWDLVAHSLSLSVSPSELLAGESRYQQSCASCHGADGTGTASSETPNFADWQAMSQRSLADLQAGYQQAEAHDAAVPDEELWHSLAYARSLAFVVPQADGLLSGQLLNGTTTQPLAQTEIKLHILQGQAEIGTQTATTDDEGRYSFEALSTDPSIQYRLESGYEGIFYVSPEPATFSAADGNETTLDLTVYDTTASDEEIYVTQLHYLLSPGLTDIEVIQIYVVGNHGDKAFVGQEGQTFPFTLPDGAESITFQGDLTGNRFTQLATNYVDSEPVIPGEEGSTVVVMYRLPHDGSRLTFDTPLLADVASVSVLMQDNGATLVSEQLQFRMERPIRGNNFFVFAAENLSQGESLQMQLLDLNNLTTVPPTGQFGAAAAVAPAGGLDQETLQWIVLSMGGLALLFAAGIYPFMRPQGEDLETQRQRLVLMVTRLDEAFKAGDLAPELYRQARSKYKAELIRLME